MDNFIGVSACLIGEKCRYDGNDSLNMKVVNFLKGKNFIAFCPEVLGGLPTPRIPAEIKGGDGKNVLKGECKIINKNGEDVTDYYLVGAKAVLEILKKHRVNLVIARQLSPACGKGKIYDGSFTGNIIEGNGIATQLLLNEGICVITEDNL